MISKKILSNVHTFYTFKIASTYEITSIWPFKFQTSFHLLYNGLFKSDLRFVGIENDSKARELSTEHKAATNLT